MTAVLGLDRLSHRRQHAAARGWAPETWPVRCAVYGACTLTLILYGLWAGKDLNWDSLNYHLYAGYSALNDRFDRDFMGAGLTGYLNPYAHVPFYLMVDAGWPALAIGLTLSSLHAVNLWLVYEFALVLLPRSLGSHRRLALALAAVSFALFNPVFLQETGSTFVDISTGLPAIAGWLLVAHVLRDIGTPQPDLRRAVRLTFAAGILLGTAASLKLSNVLFAFALLPALLLLRQPLRLRLRLFAMFALGGIVSSGIVAGPWAWKLWQHLGNPLFPFFNGLFRSPDFIVDPIRHMRFVPETLGQWLGLPFRMVLPFSMIHTEPASPDLRYAVFVVATVCGAALFAAARWRDRAAGCSVWTKVCSTPAPILTGCLVLAWYLWLGSSGNSRYFLPMACVLSALLPFWLLAAVGWHARRGLATIAILLAAQMLHVGTSAQLRWSSVHWGGPWFSVEVPAKLREHPALYLSVDPMSGAVLAPFVHPGSGLMNISGGYALGPEVPGGERAVRLIAERAGAVRTLALIEKVRQDGEPVPLDHALADGKLMRFGLRVDESDCQLISLRGGGTFVVYIEQPGVAARPHEPRTMWLSCATTREGVDPLAFDAGKRDADIVFDRIEQACPDLFSPRGGLTERHGETWRRLYMNTDVRLWAGPSGLKFYNPILAGEPILLGRFEDWLASPQKIDCNHRYAPAFGLLDLRR